MIRSFMQRQELSQSTKELIKKLNFEYGGVYDKRISELHAGLSVSDIVRNCINKDIRSECLKQFNDRGNHAKEEKSIC